MGKQGPKSRRVNKRRIASSFNKWNGDCSEGPTDPVKETCKLHEFDGNTVSIPGSFLDEKQLQVLSTNRRNLNAPEDLSQFDRLLKQLSVAAAINAVMTHHLGYETTQTRTGANPATVIPQRPVSQATVNGSAYSARS